MKAEKDLAKKLNVINGSKTSTDIVFLNHFKSDPIVLKDHEYLKFRDFVQYRVFVYIQDFSNF